MCHILTDMKMECNKTFVGPCDVADCGKIYCGLYCVLLGTVVVEGTPGIQGTY